MKTEQAANAHPRKQFFLEMFTRDISLEDCILDLIDNSIDGLSRLKELDLSPPLLTELRRRARSSSVLPNIEVDYSNNEFAITDNCGGIDKDLALTEVFSFGHAPSY